MTLPTSGPISMSQVAVEMGLPATTNLSLNDDKVRKMANKLTGAISLYDLYGKSYIPPTVIIVDVGTSSGGDEEEAYSDLEASFRTTPKDPIVSHNLVLNVQTSGADQIVPIPASIISMNAASIKVNGLNAGVVLYGVNSSNQQLMYVSLQQYGSRKVKLSGTVTLESGLVHTIPLPSTWIGLYYGPV